ncbi:MAG: BamA/TamA family outer membrane protein [Bacteroidales bacterium]|nr:BamA/TamA family outer membrane protein [Bacteroidales bacterium]
MILLFLVGCSTTKRIDKGQYLLVNNEVKIQNPIKQVSTGDLESLIKQKPNKRFIGIVPIKLWLNSMNKKWGELPTVLDRGLISETKTQMKKYLDNVGFFNSSVDDTIKFKKKKAKKVTYLVELAEPYRIRNINFSISDTVIRSIVLQKMDNSLIKSSRIYNSYTLDKERERITGVLNNYGYFSFTKDYIYYRVDSAFNSHQIDVTLVIKNVTQPPENPGETPREEFHKAYYINNVFIYPDYKPFVSDSSNLDTITEVLTRRSDTTPHEYKIVYHPPLKIKPKLLTRSMFVEPNKKYNATDAFQTYKKLNELRIFKYVNVNFRESDSAKLPDPAKNYLDCNVNLTRNPVNSYSIEAQGTNSGGDLGLAGYLIYQNKNLLNGGEIFYIKLKGALEAQEGGTDYESSPQNQFWIFNTFEAGIEANLEIPKFLAPIDQDVFSRYFRPKTILNLGYNIQNRLDYDRVITNASFGYEWSETQFKKHILFPSDINFIKVQTTPEFDSVLATESERFRNQYTDHLIFALKYSYIFNNQDINKIKNFIYFRANVETSGNLLDLATHMLGTPENSEGFRTVFGIRYSQYIKNDYDFRFYIMFDKKHSLAFRTFAGLAVAYGNSVDIPFEKGYYGGGANGMRAWPLRYLGPGAFSVPQGKSNLERVGDIMLEGNFEYRFPIYSVFRGAFFYDVGNIWLLRDNETFPDGKFEFNKFYQQLAMDIGLGIRLDFNYFIFRVDFAQRLHDPALPASKSWVIGKSSNWFNPVFNLGIGYPF